MIAEIWRLSIADSVLHATRGNFRPILELYVPDLKASMNIEGGKLHIVLDRQYNKQPCFPNEAKQQYLGMYTLSDEDATLVRKLVDAERDSARDKIAARLQTLFDSVLDLERNQTHGWYALSVAVLAVLVILVWNAWH